MLMQPRDNRLHIIRHVTWVGFWINAMLMALKLRSVSTDTVMRSLPTVFIHLAISALIS